MSICFGHTHKTRCSDSESSVSESSRHKHNKKQRNHRKKTKRDQLVGTYTFQANVTQVAAGPVSPPIPLYGNVTFHADGTIHGQDSGDIGQLGALRTVWTGEWKRLSKNQYTLSVTFVTNAPTPGTIFPTVPTNRSVLTSSFIL